MSTKGDLTKELIRKESYKLFADKGFKSVTMKDVCEATGLSRGGLYRHYESTEAIFEDIFLHMSDNADDRIMTSISKGTEAVTILEDMFSILRAEILDAASSLSLPIYEYSDACGGTIFSDLNTKGRKKWLALIEYGKEKGQFNIVDAGQVTDTILYSYQGLRMWSRVINMQEETVDNVLNQIRKILIK